MTPQQQQALQEYFDKSRAIQGLPPVQLEQLPPEDLQKLQQSAMQDIGLDTTGYNAQLEALRGLEERSQMGLSAQDKADLFRIKTQQDSANRGRLGAIQQNMANRGMAGSGLDMVAQLQSAQDAAQIEALRGMEQAAQSQNQKFQATQALGNMGGNLVNQRYQMDANKAKARDAINQFNTSMMNTNAQNNLNVRNQNIQNQYNQRLNAMKEGQAASQMGYNVATEDANRKMLEGQQRRQQEQAKRGAIFGTVGAIGGGIAGGMAGGPMGAAYGASTGAQLGQGLSYAGGYADGGIIPYDQRDINAIPGDNPLNDNKLASVSAGEAIVPKSIVESSLSDPTNSAWNAYLDKLRSDVASQRQGVEQAQTLQAANSGVNTLVDLVNRYNQGNTQSPILYNKIQNLGNTPTTVQNQTPQLDNSAGTNLVNMVGQQRLSDLAQSQGKLDQGQQMKRDEAILQQKLNQQASESDFQRQQAQAKAGYQAQQDAENKRRFEAEMDFKNKQLGINTNLRERELNKQGIAADKPLSIAQAKQRGLADLGERAEAQYQEALKKGDVSGKYKPTGYGDWIDNTGWLPNFLKSDAAIEARSAANNWIEAYLRDASGAAIPESEREAYFVDFFPQPGDTPQTVANKQALRQQKMDNARLASGNTTPAQQLSPEDQEALDWANSNPNDPRSKQIKQSLGM